MAQALVQAKRKLIGDSRLRRINYCVDSVPAGESDNVFVLWKRWAHDERTTAVKGDYLQDLRSDWTGAQEWYAKAVKLGPSIPSGYYSWGVALAKHGDLDGAAAKLQLANQKGPHWADPLKTWGDVLMKQGKSKEALSKYEEALKYAPNWKQLKEAREAAAKSKT